MAHEILKLQFTNEVISKVDLGRLRRELSAIDDFIIQSKVRKAGQQPTLPRTSLNLEELAKANKFNLLVDGDRKGLNASLTELYSHAPVLHISFASEPSPAFLKKIITWLRTEIHPNILLQTGLQPSIAAGCIVQSNSKYFDLSLRKRFEKNRGLLNSGITAKEPSNG